jgi:ComF family protein
MEPNMVVNELDGIKATSLFVYNDKVKQMLYQCKGCFDYEMAEVFLSRQRSFLKRKYRNWVLVPAPSYEEKDKVRGFNHVEEMFKGLERPFVHAIEKKDNVKQADLNFAERQQIGKHLVWKEGVSVAGLNVLFVDDLLTTGATAKACAKMLLEHGANKVEILVMARTIDPKNRKENKISFSRKLLQIVDGFKKKIRGERN